MKYCVGLTGAIASGKSTVAHYFNQLGIQIINADTVAKQLVSMGTYSYQQIVNRHGPSILTEEKQLNRKKLRELIFNDADERLWLEQLLHPQIRLQLIKEINETTSPYCMAEIPLLKNKKDYPVLNRVLLVMSPLETQIQRIIIRDHCTKNQALAIIKTQPSIEDRLKLADDVLINDCDLNALENKVNQLHTQYLQLALGNL